MTLVSIFFIILITAFAVVAFFTEPSKADKQIHSRLTSLGRERVSSGHDEPDIVKEVTFSTIPAFDKFLRNSRAAVGLQLLIEQCDLQWTVGRIVFSTLVLICLGAVLGNWWIAPGLVGWAPGLALGAVPYVFLLQKRTRRLRRFSELLRPWPTLAAVCPFPICSSWSPRFWFRRRPAATWLKSWIRPRM